MPIGDGAGGAGMLCSGLVLTCGRVARRLRCCGVLGNRGWISRYSMEEEATVPGGARGELRCPPVMARSKPEDEIRSTLAFVKHCFYCNI